MITRRFVVFGLFGMGAAPGVAMAHKPNKTFTLDAQYQPQSVTIDPEFAS